VQLSPTGVGRITNISFCHMGYPNQEEEANFSWSAGFYAVGCEVSGRHIRRME